MMVMLKGEGKKNARSPLMGHALKVPAGWRQSRRPGGAEGAGRREARAV